MTYSRSPEHVTCYNILMGVKQLMLYVGLVHFPLEFPYQFLLQCQCYESSLKSYLHDIIVSDVEETPSISYDTPRMSFFLHLHMHFS